jgi:hypothetical protein
VITATTLDDFTHGYVEALLWAERADLPGADPNDDKSLSDAGLGWDDFAPEAQAKIVADCAAFQLNNAADLAAGPLTPRSRDYPGHDFWLTRQGHGCGFWDGDWPEAAGERLAAASKQFGELYPCVGDDGRIYF